MLYDQQAITGWNILSIIAWRKSCKTKNPTIVGFSISGRKARDSNPRTCYSQQFSRLPHSTTLPAFRRQKYKLRLNLQTLIMFFLYKIDNYLTQSEKKLFLLNIFFNWLRFFEEIKGRADNFYASFAYINTGIQLKTDQQNQRIEVKPDHHYD